MYDNVYSTYDAKSIISKSLILPKVSYTATVLSIPNDVCNSLENLIVKYIIPRGKSMLSLTDLAQKRSCGGYNIDHTWIHASVFMLIPIFKYVKNKVENIPLSNEQYYIEYNIGLQLSQILGIPFNNCTPHRVTPMKSYALILRFIKEMGISGEDLIKGKVKTIYEKIILRRNQFGSASHWSRNHCNVLPNYLKTFNYKLSMNILPCKTNFVDFGLDTDSRCNFCNIHPDTVPHMFSRCSVLSPIWRILDLALDALKVNFRFSQSRKHNDYDLRNSVLNDHEDLIIYLNSIVNFKVWKVNLAIQYENAIFDSRSFFCSLIKTLEGRKRMQLSDQMKHCQKVGSLDILISFLKSYIFVPSGIG